MILEHKNIVIGRYICRQINNTIRNIPNLLEIGSIGIGSANWEILSSYLRTDPDIDYNWYINVDKVRGLKGFSITWIEKKNGWPDGIHVSQTFALDVSIERAHEYELKPAFPVSSFDFEAALSVL